MKDKKEKTDFEKFSEATKQLMSVPKSEIDRRHAEWEKQRERKRKAKTLRRASRDSDA